MRRRRTTPAGPGARRTRLHTTAAVATQRGTRRRIPQPTRGPRPPSSVSFPSKFLWGTATAGYQVEKGDDNTDWTAWVAMAGKIANGDNPDVGGPDALDHVAADVQDPRVDPPERVSLLARVGAPLSDARRVQLEHPGPHRGRRVHERALGPRRCAHHAGRDAQSLHAAELPRQRCRALAAPGVENAQTTTLFVEFCSRMAARLGGQVDYWLTVNEPMVLAVGGYLQGSIPPGVVFDIDRTIAVIKAQALAHTQAYDAIHAADTVTPTATGRPRSSRSRSTSGRSTRRTLTSAADIAATAHVEYLWNQWFYNVVVLGNWDDDFDGNYTGPNDKMGDPTLKGRADFLGVNYYSDTLISATNGDHHPGPGKRLDRAGTPRHGAARDGRRVGHLRRGAGHGASTRRRRYGARPSSSPRTGSRTTRDANRPRFLLRPPLSAAGGRCSGGERHRVPPLGVGRQLRVGERLLPQIRALLVRPTTEVRTARPSAMEFASIIQAGKVTLAELDASNAYATPRRCASSRRSAERRTRRIRAAANAAPNPLSMFTTVTPEAQLVSIPSSAARPWKAAPYPTDVGTAMMGASTSPPTTLASAPSMPAKTMTTAAVCEHLALGEQTVDARDPDVVDARNLDAEHP